MPDLPRTHPLTFVDRPKDHRGRWCLGYSLGLSDTDERSIAVDTTVQDIVERGGSIQACVQALAEMELTDAEYTSAVYSLGWFHCAIRGGKE